MQQILQRCFLVLGLFSLQLLQANGVCVEPSVDNTVAVNLHFKYDGVDKLDGTQSDSFFFSKLAAGAKVPQLNFSDNVFRSKAQFLRSVKMALETKSYVIFNYSGHGDLVPKLDKNGKWDGKAMEWAILLPVGDSDEAPAKVNFATQSIEEKIKKVEMEPWQDSVITESDLAKVFNNKSVFGIVDACLSGAITTKITNKDSCLLCSCNKDQESRDSYRLGIKPEDIKQAKKLSDDIDAFDKKLTKMVTHNMDDITYLVELTHKHPKDHAKEIVEFLEKSRPKLTAEALALSERRSKIYDEFQTAKQIKGGLLVNYLAKTDGKALDLNKDGFVSFEELRNSTPTKLYSHPLVQVQNTKIVSSGCSKIEALVGFPSAVFGPKAKEVPAHGLDKHKN